MIMNKVFNLSLAILGTALCSTQAQLAETSRDNRKQEMGTQILERGSNYRVVQTRRLKTDSSGQAREVIEQYTELADGMHYFKNGQWLESKEIINPALGGGEAVEGPLKVKFPVDLYTRGGIEITGETGEKMSLHLAGIAYYDSESGKTIAIAQVRSTEGKLLGDNQVLYADACEGVSRIDVIYTYRKGNCEQDVVIRENLPDPALFGLNRDTTTIRIYNELVSFPGQDKLNRNELEKTLTPQLLSLGNFRFLAGKAFSIGQNDPKKPRKGSAVFKSLKHLDNSDFLVEEVPYNEVKAELSKLPKAQAALPAVRKPVQQVKWEPAPARQTLDKLTKRVEVAAYQKQRGYVFDYVTINQNQTDYRFQGDQTYYINGYLTFSGITTIEGGAVLKYGDDADLNVYGLKCETDPFHPAIITSKNDSRYGAFISSGNPNTRSFWAIDYFGSGGSLNLKHLRVYFAEYAFVFFDINAVVQDVQVNNSALAFSVDDSTVDLQNALLCSNSVVFLNNGTSASIGNQLTIDQCGTLNQSGTLRLTNSLITDLVSQGAGMTSANQVYTTSRSGVYQTVGSGEYYLANNSPYRNIGAAVPTSLVSLLSERTTWPPIALNGGIGTDAVLEPVVARGTNSAPDIGYHYYPLDYLVGYFWVTNGAALVLTNGVSLGIEYWGQFYLCNGAKFQSCGTPLQMNTLATLETVQEGYSDPFFNNFSVAGSGVTLDLRFTRLTGLGGANYAVDGSGAFSSLSMRDCEVLGGVIYLPQTASAVQIGFTNNLFDRTLVDLRGGTGLAMNQVNNLFRGGTVSYASTRAGNAILMARNNAFENTFLPSNGNFTVTADHNAYTSGQTNRWYPTNQTDVIVGGFNYQTGSLGRFYLPAGSALIGAGSANANTFGLYHFTTQINQTKEANSAVDIGYHYVALNASLTGLADSETSPDGLPDYLEDTNGDGTYDSADLSSWQNTDTDGDGVSDFAEYRAGRSPRNNGTSTDSSGTLKLKVYTPLK